MSKFSTVFEAVFSHSETRSSKAALIFGEEKITYSQLEARSETLALRFLSMGIGYGDRIAYVMRSVPAFFYASLAASMVGATAVGIAYRTPEAAAAVMLHDSAAKAIVCEDELYGTYRALSSIPVLTASELISDTPDTSFKAALAAAESKVTPDTPLFVLFTSGTTAKPKGAVFTHRNLLSSAKLQNSSLFPPTGLTDEDVIAHYLPVNHVSGCIEAGIDMLIDGGTLVLEPVFRPDIILPDIVKYRISILVGVPAMWRMFLMAADNVGKDCFRSVRTAVSGAAFIEESMVERMLGIFDCVENPMGMTETSGLITLTPHPKDAHLISSTIGLPMKGIEITVLGEDKKPTGPGEIGTLAYRGDSVIGSYLGIPLPTDVEGRYISGDMGYYGEDGLLRLCGRSDDMFTVGGYNVFPIEIEETLLKYPGVTGAVVLPIPHRTMGSVCRAYITVDREVDTAKLEEFCAINLIYFKVPKNYVITDRFPVNAMAKVERRTMLEAIKEEFGK